jgi:hypothetical protein
MNSTVRIRLIVPYARVMEWRSVELDHSMTKTVGVVAELAGAKGSC